MNPFSLRHNCLEHNQSIGKNNIFRINESRDTRDLSSLVDRVLLFVQRAPLDFRSLNNAKCELRRLPGSAK